MRGCWSGSNNSAVARMKRSEIRDCLLCAKSRLRSAPSGLRLLESQQIVEGVCHGCIARINAEGCRYRDCNGWPICDPRGRGGSALQQLENCVLEKSGVSNNSTATTKWCSLGRCLDWEG